MGRNGPGTVGIVERPLPEPLTALLGSYLARQRWYAGEGLPAQVQVAESGEVCRAGATPVGMSEAGAGRLWWAIVEAGGSSYQLTIAERPTPEAVEKARGHEEAMVGVAGDIAYYDATVDAEMAVALLEVASGGREEANRARQLSAEQSNTSLVYDDRLILKLFRRLSLGGPNPDVEVSTALARAGFVHIAEPLVRWRRGDVDLAFGQQYLSGGTDGWALALTSIRDLYGATASEQALAPSQSGGDFAAEAFRLGQVTAQMHLAMAETYGSSDDLRRRWGQLVDALAAQVRNAVPELAEPGAPLIERLRSVRHPGPAVRAHGDYHLGQVMRTDAGWFVLDFEGEPNRPVEERLAPTSVMKDVAGMLRSLQYAPNFVLRERGEPGVGALAEMAAAWEVRNRRAFLSGYYDTKGIDELLPAAEDREAVRAAFELEKALYELGYELAYRPAWAPIPKGALEALLRNPVEQVVGQLVAGADDGQQDGTDDAEQALP